jgi:serine/threonine protein phosphatase PrpC
MKGSSSCSALERFAFARIALATGHPMARLEDEFSSFSDDDCSDDFGSFGLTDRGLKRQNNQDHFLIARLTKSMRVLSTSLPVASRLHGRIYGNVLVVADGMGGHAAGEMASKLAIWHLIQSVLNKIHWHFQGETEEADFIESLQSILRATHNRVLAESQRHIEMRGMGTTITLAYVIWPTLYVLHAGDSRCYLIRDGDCGQITTDHTLARKMVEAGGLSPEEEKTSRWSNVLWNVIGGNGEGVIAEVHRVELQADDIILLCSDGLHRYVSELQIARAITEHDSPEGICKHLLDLALQSGGEDNITVALYQASTQSLMKSTWIDEFETQPRSGRLESPFDAYEDKPGTTEDFDPSNDPPDPLAETMPEDF